jgi:hypothetical protein
MFVLHERHGTKPDLAMLPPVFDHYREIAEGKLSAHAAWVHNGAPTVISALIGLPHDLQDRLADGEKIKIAVRNKEGRIVSDERRLDEMTGAELARAFRNGHVIDWTYQGEALVRAHNEAPEGGKAKPPRVTIDPETQMVMVNRTRVPDDLLFAALLQRGLMVKPVYSKPMRVA